MRWFMWSWWQYLLTDCSGWTNFICRVRGHPCGIWWYSGGDDPDTRCKNCGDDLG
jgi:hypothetical protein